MRNILISLSFIFLASCSATKVDTIVHHGVIYTVDSAFTIVQAMAIKDGKIIATGTNENILKQYKAIEEIDAKGKAIYPGFIDAHSHFLEYGRILFEVNLFGTTSWEDVLQRIKDFSKKTDTTNWIVGMGWDQNDWAIKQFPTNENLNELFPNTPLVISRVDGHAAIANAKALEIAGITPNQTIEGGEFETTNGKLTGILIDNASSFVRNFIPPPAKKDFEKRLLAAQANSFAQGLTTVADCGINYNDVEMIDGLQKEGKLNMKVYALLSDNKPNYEHYLAKGPYKTDKLFVNGFKFYADGALGSRGACLLHPYSDKLTWSGFLLSSPNHFDSMANVLSKTNFQMCTHAIGDSANHTILNIYAKYLQPKNDKRWRIEHAQVVAEDDVAMFGKYSIVPSVQPTHATSDMTWAMDRLGKERIKTAYAYQQLFQENGWLPLGTDFPIEDISPIKTFYAAVIRKDNNGKPAKGFQKENALTREQALRGITIWAAKGCFLEKEVGSLEVGKKADFIIIDQDLMKVPEKEILATKVTATYSDGKKR